MGYISVVIGVVSALACLACTLNARKHKNTSAYRGWMTAMFYALAFAVSSLISM